MLLLPSCPQKAGSEAHANRTDKAHCARCLPYRLPVLPVHTPCAGIVAAVGFDKNEWAELLKELTGWWLHTPAVQGERTTC